ncbi:hypothetical protein EJB05_16291, partial [Eragrostis curvula]
MPVATRSQAAAAAHPGGSAAPGRGRDGGPRRGTQARHHHGLAEEEAEGAERGASLGPEAAAALMRENVAPPKSQAPSTNKGPVVFASQAKPQEMEDAALPAASCAFKSAGREIPLGGGADGNLELEAGAGSADDAKIRELQMKVKNLEAEIERMKADERLLRPKQKAADDDSESEAATAARRAVTRARSRKARRGAAAASDAAERHISSLGDDIILEIFLRLPSLATLVRAACTCSAWRRAVASSPAFRSRFRALHPAPLLGLFADPIRSGLPVFIRTHSRDRDVLAALRGGDFIFTSLHEVDDDVSVPVQWLIYGSWDGYLFLLNQKLDLDEAELSWSSDSRFLAAVNPLARQCRDRAYIVFPYEDMVAGYCSYHHFTNVVSLSPDEGSLSLQLICLCYDESRVRAAVYSSNTRDWRVLPWVVVAERRPLQDYDDGLWLRPLMQGSGKVYCPLWNNEYMLTLDTATMEFTVSQLPSCLKEAEDRELMVGATKDGSFCIAYDTGHGIGILMRGVDEKWVRHDVPLRKDEYVEVLNDNGHMDFLAIRDGFVYLATTDMVMSLNLETMELEMLFPKTLNGQYNSFYPYFMAWPPSLVGNYGRFAEFSGGSINA